MCGSRLVVVVLVLVAGCSGALGGDDGDGRATVNPALEGTPTASPTPTPTPTPTLNESLPSGVTTAVVDANLLGDRHRTVLRRVSRTVRRSTTVTAPNGTVIGRTRTTITATRERDDEVVVDGVAGGTNPAAVGLPQADFAFWTNGTAAASRRTPPDGPPTYSYRFGNLPPGPQADTTGQGVVAAAFRLVNLTSVELLYEQPVSGGSTALYRVEGAAAAPIDDVRNVSLVATLTGAGVVRDLRVTYTLVRDDRRFRVVRELRVFDVGETTVSRPDWVAVARNATADGPPHG